MIHNIVFDFGGVMVEYDFPKYFTKFFGCRKKAMWFINNILTEENNDKLDKADKPFNEYISEWKQQWPEYADALDAFDKHYADIYPCEVSGMFELMTELKAKGYRLLGLSNWSIKVFNVMHKFPRIFALLDGRLISHEVHLIKPHKEIYGVFCNKFNVTPESCVFIDDRADNIEGAKSIGMQGIVFKNTEQLKAELITLKI